MTDHLKITPDDRNNPLWQKIEAQLKNRLVSLRTQLEGKKDFDETNVIRGRIAEVKLMLDATAEKPYVPQSDFVKV